MKRSWRQRLAAHKREVLVAFAIFAVTLTTFLISRVHQVADSRYMMLLSESLLEHGSFTLDAYQIAGVERTAIGFSKPDNLYQLEIVNNHVYYQLPPGSSVLSLPFAALMKLAGLTSANPDGSYDNYNEVKLQVGLAALLMAALACVFFITARLVLPMWWSVLAALGGAWGTQVWSTASRAVWSDTWGILLLGIALWMLVAAETGKGRLRPVLLATLLSWMYFTRPTNSLPIFAVTIYLLVFYRRLFIWYAVTGLLWFAVFVAYSWSHFGQMLPTYYQAGRLTFEHFGEALAGNLISPARGLLIYVPVLFFIFYLLVRYRQSLEYPRLVLLSLAVIVLHWIATSGFPHWYGGHSFGPRLMTGIVPWLVLLGILSLRAMLRWRDEHASQVGRAWWRTQNALGAVLLVLSMWINGLGATSHATWLWNQRPVDVDSQPSRIWDWQHPQFLAQWQN